MAKKKLEEKKISKKLAGAKENEVRSFSTASRGRTFKGKVIRKFPKRATIEFERTVKIRKFERFMKKKTRIHARLPDDMAHDIQVGDLIKVQECRPLSKMIHFIVIEKLRDVGSGDEKPSNEEKK